MSTIKPSVSSVEIIDHFLLSFLLKGEFNVFCADCGKTFPSHQKLAIHSIVHLTTRDFLCSVCAKTFKSQLSLNAHIKTHVSQNPFHSKWLDICGHWTDFAWVHSVCMKSVWNETTVIHSIRTPTTLTIFLKFQISSQTSIKATIQPIDPFSTHFFPQQSEVHPFACSICGKKFILKYQCRRHEMRHKKIKEKPAVSATHDSPHKYFCATHKYFFFHFSFCNFFSRFSKNVNFAVIW